MSMEKVIELLVFPFILLGAGTGITHWVIPGITRKWQNRQKALKIKTDLIAELIQLLMTILVNGNEYHEAKGDGKEKLKKMNEDRKKTGLFRNASLDQNFMPIFLIICMVT